jgi:hypothetical protein
MAHAAMCALSATLASTLPCSASQAAGLDLVQLIAILRNPQLDAVFETYVDRDVEIDSEVLNIGVRYGWIKPPRRPALGLESRFSDKHVSRFQGLNYERYQDNRNLLSVFQWLMTSCLPLGGL